MQTPNSYWLTGVEYLEGKRAVLACFSQLDIRRTLRVPFFPYFFVGKRFAGRELLREVLSAYGAKKFRLECAGNSFKITARTFKDLQCLANIVFTSLNFIPIVIRPERQFLLEKGWAFFQCFDFSREEQPVKLESNAFPDARLPFFSEPLRETVSQLLKSDREQALKILESLALSSLLAIPFESMPASKAFWLEILFENAFYGMGLNRQPCQPDAAPAGHDAQLRFKSGLTELDLGMLWPALLTKPIYNIGFDSIDCECCRPEGISSQNILPNSTALVEIQQEAFYFESLLPGFAKQFHESNPETRCNRLRRMREFCLSAVPVGPFSRSQLAALPLADAMRLAEDSSAKIISLQETHWFCTRNESVLSKVLVALHSKAECFEKSVSVEYSEALKKHGVLGPSSLENSPEHLFKKALLSACSLLLAGVIPRLTSGRGAFYSRELAESIESVQASVLHNFSRLAEKGRGRLIASKQGAFIRTDRPLGLMNDFSNAVNAPAVIKAKLPK